MQEELKGTISDIIFHNDDNGYTIALVENQEDLLQFTAVGYLHTPGKGREYAFTGQWKVHKVYGEQFAFDSYTELIPETEEGIKAFLSSGIMKGIGQKTAAALVAAFSDDTLRIIEEEPEKLTQVPGIGDHRAGVISRAFKSHREFANISLYLQPFGISPSYGLKLYKVFGEDTIKVIEENPYQLIDEIAGIGFKRADRIANKLGFEPGDIRRIKSGIKYVLSVHLSDGDSFVPRKLLCEEAGELLDISAEEVYEAVVSLAFEGDLHVESLQGREVVYLVPYFLAEQKVCRKLIELENSSVKALKGEWEDLLAMAQAQSGVYLSESQKEAVRLATENGIAVITGGPGTGKTTIINTIVNIFERSNLKTVIAAPTGRAAKRITETSGYESSTIHRLLEYYYSEGEEAMRFGINEENPLDGDVVIIDEASMIDILLMRALVEALPRGARLILVGDADQLPSVGAGNVLRDILDSEIIPSMNLTEIFRQAEESMIVVNAHRINKGEYPYCNERDKDFFLLSRKTEVEMLEVIKDLCVRRLPERYEGLDPARDIQVLSPVRRGTIGSINLNKELQNLLNPPSPLLEERKHGDRIFRTGDKVMQIKNNYQLEWKKSDDFTEGQGVFNGDGGFIHNIDQEFGEVTVVYEDSKYVTYDNSNLDELELAYAMTVHKSQGSEFPVVIMPVSWFPPMLATRNLLYTAVTRAKEMVVLVGSEGKMQAMVDNNRITERFSGLAIKLKNFLSP